MNILPVGSTQASSADQTFGATGQVLLFLTDADGGYSPVDAQVNVEFKAASGVYMRQAMLSYEKSSMLISAIAGTVFRVTRIAGTVGVDAQGNA